MEANELMKGDWVYNTHNQQPEQVVEIRERMVMLAYNDLYDYDEIEPIPLTGEILETNEFTLHENCTSAWDWHRGEESIHISGGPDCPIGQTVTIYVSGHCAGAAFSSHRVISEMRFRGIHELQHIMKDAGIKKEFSL